MTFLSFCLSLIRLVGAMEPLPLALLWLCHPLEIGFWTSCIMSAAAGAAGSPCPTPASPVSGDSLD